MPCGCDGFPCEMSGTSVEPAPPGGSRYTRTVSWRHRISFVVLIVLAALPVSSALCAVVCDASATMSGHHHGAGKASEETAPPSSQVQLRSVSEHDCNTHDAVIRQTTTTAAERADAAAGSAPLMVSVSHATVTVPVVASSTAEYNAPPGTPPPTATPLVLRV